MSKIIQVGPDRRFIGPVAVGAAENRRAHGGITRTERRSSDGARRAVNINGPHREIGPWVKA